MPSLPPHAYQSRACQRLIYSVGLDGLDQGGSVDWGYDFNKAADWLFPLPDTEH